MRRAQALKYLLVSNIVESHPIIIIIVQPSCALRLALRLAPAFSYSVVFIYSTLFSFLFRGVKAGKFGQSVARLCVVFIA